MRGLLVAMFASVAECTEARHPEVGGRRTALVRIPHPDTVDQHGRWRDRETGRFLTTSEQELAWTWGTRGWGATDELAAIDAGETMVRALERELRA